MNYETFGGFSKYSERYQDAEQVIQNNPNIKFLKGHSLGGSVALSLNENCNCRFSTTTYGVPVFNLKKLMETTQDLEVHLTQFQFLICQQLQQMTIH